MKLLDLYCGAGGAAMGYHQAGFTEIVGVDIEPHPNYPFEFIQDDALEFIRQHPKYWDLIHASPPCQVHSTLSTHLPGGHSHVDLVAVTRSAMRDTGIPYVIENVPGAPLQYPTKLCGSVHCPIVDGHQLRRHRLFEASFPIAPTGCNHSHPVLGVYGDLSKNPRAKNPRAKETGVGGGGVKAGIAQAQRLMGIDWMTRHELVQAIPPAYTRYIGEQFIAQKIVA